MERKTSIDIGKEWESIASDYLKNKGYKILEQNWRFKHLEIDIIAEKDNFLIISEVKYRTYTTFGEPETFVNQQKQKFLMEAAHQYVLQKEIDKEIRFDIIAITKKNNHLHIHHIEDAFYAR
ncbi:MAG: YraN family protein [Bacteroidia bacterium]|nr:YraN family protein [Bacteroidia bacterium]